MNLDRFQPPSEQEPRPRAKEDDDDHREKMRATQQHTIEELGRRFDYCRTQVSVEALDDFANSRWAKMADNMEKAVRELKLCIRDARILSQPNRPQ